MAESVSMSRKDKWAIAVLLLLYTIQGIPMGLASSVPFLLQTKTAANYSDQALFAFCTWPFSLKLLWAPIVDSVYIKSFGQRKTWLIPVQAAAAFAMLYAGAYIDEMMGIGDESATPDIRTLTVVFFSIYFLMATQDIAVDGWALTMLSKENVEMGSTCNTIGQSLGYFASFVGFLALNDSTVCNNRIRPILGIESSDEPMVTLGGFLVAFGWLTLATTVLIALFKSEAAADSVPSVQKAYKELALAASQPEALKLFLILLTYRIGFVAADNLTHLKMIEYGFPKEEIAIVTPMLLPIGLLVPVLARYYMLHPLRVWINAFPIRLLIGVADIWIVYNARHNKAAAFWGFVALSVVWTIVGTLMFTAQMEYFATEAVRNPALGGSYMTLLNTVANLGGSWPQPLVLWLLEFVTTKEEPCTKDPECDCILQDGFYPITIASILLGILWLIFMKPVLMGMAQRSETAAQSKKEV